MTNILYLFCSLLYRRERPKVLVHDSDDMWPLIEDHVNCPPSSQPHLHPVTVPPDNNRYVIKRLSLSYEVEKTPSSQFTADASLGVCKAPFLHLKLLNADLVSDTRTRRTELMDWSQRLNGGEYLIVLVHPTLIQQPAAPAKLVKEDKKGALETLFSKKSPIDQAKQKLMDAEGKLREKLKQKLICLWHVRDSKELVREIRGCIFASFLSRLQERLNQAQRLILRSNICPYLSTMDEIGFLQKQFGLSDEAAATYNKVASTLEGLQAPQISRSFHKSGVQDDYVPDIAGYFALFSTDVSENNCKPILDALKHQEQRSHQRSDSSSSTLPSPAQIAAAAASSPTSPQALASPTQTEILSEMNIRTVFFLRQVSSRISLQRCPTKIASLFSRVWLPRLLKSLQNREIKDEVKISIAFACQLSFANMLSMWELRRSGNTKTSTVKGMSRVDSVHSNEGVCDAEECMQSLPGFTRERAGGTTTPGRMTPPTLVDESTDNLAVTSSSMADTCDGVDELLRKGCLEGGSTSHMLMYSKSASYMSLREAVHSAYIETVQQSRESLALLGRLHGLIIYNDIQSIESSTAKFSDPQSVLNLPELWKAPEANEHEEDEEEARVSHPLNFPALSSQEAFDELFLSFCMHSIKNNEISGRIHALRGLEREILPTLSVCGYLGVCISLQQRQITHYESYQWTKLSIRARKDLVTLLMKIVDSDEDVPFNSPASAFKSPPLPPRKKSTFGELDTDNSSSTMLLSVASLNNSLYVNNSAPAQNGNGDSERSKKRLLRLWGCTLLHLLSSDLEEGVTLEDKNHFLGLLLATSEKVATVTRFPLPLSPFANIVSAKLTSEEPASFNRNNAVQAEIKLLFPLPEDVLAKYKIQCCVQLKGVEESVGVAPSSRRGSRYSERRGVSSQRSISLANSPKGSPKRASDRAAASGAFENISDLLEEKKRSALLAHRRSVSHPPSPQQSNPPSPRDGDDELSSQDVCLTLNAATSVLRAVSTGTTEVVLMCEGEPTAAAVYTGGSLQVTMSEGDEDGRSLTLRQAFGPKTVSFDGLKPGEVHDNVGRGVHGLYTVSPAAEDVQEMDGKRSRMASSGRSPSQTNDKDVLTVSDDESPSASPVSPALPSASASPLLVPETDPLPDADVKVAEFVPATRAHLSPSPAQNLRGNHLFSCPNTTTSRSASILRSNESTLKQGLAIKVTEGFWPEYCVLNLVDCSINAQSHRFSNTDDSFTLRICKTGFTSDIGEFPTLEAGTSFVPEFGTAVATVPDAPSGTQVIGFVVLEGVSRSGTATHGSDGGVTLRIDNQNATSSPRNSAQDNFTTLTFTNPDVLASSLHGSTDNVTVLPCDVYPHELFFICIDTTAPEPESWDLLLPLPPTIYHRAFTVSFVYQLEKRLEVCLLYFLGIFSDKF